MSTPAPGDIIRSVAAAGVDFSYMLYADQLGMHVPRCTSKTGIGWVRMATDLPAAAVAILRGDTNITSYLRSLGHCNVEAVHSFGDPLPGLIEVLMIPYLAMKRGY